MNVLGSVRNASPFDAVAGSTKKAMHVGLTSGVSVTVTVAVTLMVVVVAVEIVTIAVTDLFGLY